MRRSSLAPIVAGLVAAGLMGCAGSRKVAGDDAPTLASLAQREVTVAPDPGIAADEARTIAAYKDFLDAAPRATQRSQALRRLGDLEMDRADNRLAQGEATASGAPDYGVAIARYQAYLKAYPDDPGNDRVLYQLARAHEQGGALETALTTLDRLVAAYPRTTVRDEVHFRRGELLFATREYARAEQAYATVLDGTGGGTANAYQERALYMQGWSRFKQGRLEDALRPLFGVLDRKIAHQAGEGELESLRGLTRADRELVEDTFRVVSIALANLQGAQSIPAYIDSEARRSYEFRVYQQLGELYLRQDRTKDAADTFSAFARRQPLHAQAPQLQARVIEIYQRSGFATLALDAKKDYVSHYGVASEFRRANPQGWEGAQPLVKTHLTELARHHHAAAQKSRSSADAAEAVRWYRAYVTAFPDDPATAQNHFLLAELLFEDARYAEAVVEYETVAYRYPTHARSADAGYAALLAHAAQAKGAGSADATALQRADVASALRFAETFGADPRAGAVLTRAAEQLYALRDGDRAAATAQQVLALKAPLAPSERRTAWTVVAHVAFERGAFADAERGYGEVLALTPEKDAARAELTERLAAAIYKQGEQARSAGRARDAVGHFARVATLTPQSSVRATAQYDAAAALIGLKDWDGATLALEDFRQRFPQHALQAEVGDKLAVAYLEQGRWAQAAAEFERIAADAKAPQRARDASWQAAELYDKAQARPQAARAYQRFLDLDPPSLEAGLEARARLARIARAAGNTAREWALMKEILRADEAGGAARTARTRHLGAVAALALAEPLLDSYRKVALVEPLARQLKAKKARMEEVLKAYAVAADYGVAEVTTAATFHIGALYQDFGRALMTSQRPRQLKKAELEQYNVMLEEQAFPFEEKAIELHEVNAKRTAQGLYDAWVERSFKSLAELRPVRYGKVERSEGVIDAIR